MIVKEIPIIFAIKIQNGKTEGLPQAWQTILYDNPAIEKIDEPTDEFLNSLGYERFIVKEFYLEKTERISLGDYYKNEDGYWEVAYSVRPATEEEILELEEEEKIKQEMETAMQQEQV